jgi:hypothetical protein
MNDHFRVVCQTLDEQGMAMRDESLVIEKRACVLYTRRKYQFELTLAENEVGDDFKAIATY